MNSQFNSSFLSPRYWPTWLVIGLLWLSVKLPLHWQYQAGRLIGKFLHAVLRRRRHVADVNLKLCFPELASRERAARVRAVFEHNSIGLLETAMSWWQSPVDIQQRTHCIGQEHLDAAKAQGKGVILLGAHYTVLDMGGPLLSPCTDYDCFYRPNNNALFDYWINRGRQRFADRLLQHKDMRAVVRRLREGKVIWFAPDQDQGPTHSIYAPFFGVPAATVTSTARLAKMAGAVVVPVTFHRVENDHYEIEFQPALEDFPCGDDQADANQINQVLEQLIRKDPAQYMWVHRRFKTHPQGKNYLYR